MGKSKIKNWAINIDKLKVCFNISDDIYEYLSENYTRIEIKNDTRLRFLEEDYFTLVFLKKKKTR